MKRLVIAPHVDDDVLGCASVLDADTATFYCGVDAYHRVTSGRRREEAEAVAAVTGGQFYWPSVRAPGITTAITTAPRWASEDGPCVYETDRHVNRYDVPSLIRDLDLVIAMEEPIEVFIPWPSYNQDHRAVYEAALVALVGPLLWIAANPAVHGGNLRRLPKSR